MWKPPDPCEQQPLTVVSDGARLLELDTVNTLKGGEVAEGELGEELGGLPGAVLHGEVGVGLDLEASEGGDREGAKEARVAYRVSLVLVAAAARSVRGPRLPGPHDARRITTASSGAAIIRWRFPQTRLRWCSTQCDIPEKP